MREIARVRLSGLDALSMRVEESPVSRGTEAETAIVSVPSTSCLGYGAGLCLATIQAASGLCPTTTICSSRVREARPEGRSRHALVGRPVVASAAIYGVFGRPRRPIEMEASHGQVYGPMGLPRLSHVPSRHGPQAPSEAGPIGFAVEEARVGKRSAETITTAQERQGQTASTCQTCRGRGKRSRLA